MKKTYYLLIFLFLLSLALRLSFSYNVPYFSDDNSYFVVRQVEYIIENQVPLYTDPLSYSGRTYIFSPIYHYTLAFFSFFMPLQAVFKIIPNLLASLMVFLVFFITKSFTKNDYISLFTATVSIFIPVFVKHTYNSLNTITLILPITFYAIYLLVNQRKGPHYMYGYITLLIFLSLLSPLSILLVLGSLIYLLLCKLTGIRNDNTEKELIIFSTFFVIWSQFLLYKNTFLQHGARVIWQNLPQQLLNDYFSQFSIAQAIYLIGFFIFLCGIYVIYQNIFSEKEKKIYFFFGFAISVIVLSWFKLIPFSIGLIFLGFIFVILFGYFLSLLFSFTSKAHITQFNLLFILLLFGFVIFGSVIPTFIETYKTVHTSHNEADINSFVWLKENVPKDATILVPVDQGHLLTYYTSRKNVMDTNYILIPDVNERLETIDEIYQTTFKNNAIRLMNKYKIDYVVFSHRSQQKYSTTELKYIDNNCFKEIYNVNNVSIYQSLCTVEEK